MQTKTRLDQIEKGDETILIVEDEPYVRKTVVRLLEVLGYHVFSAQNGHEALEIVDKMGETISLVVTDVVMPGMDGRTMAQAILQKHPGIGVLYVSGYAEDRIRKSSMTHIDVDFIQKPFNPSQLSKAIRTVLQKKAVDRFHKSPETAAHRQL